MSDGTEVKFIDPVPTVPARRRPASNPNVRDQKPVRHNMENAHTEPTRDSLLSSSYCHSACTPVYYIVPPIAYGNWPFPSTMMSCVE